MKAFNCQKVESNVILFVCLLLLSNQHFNWWQFLAYSYVCIYTVTSVIFYLILTLVQSMLSFGVPSLSLFSQ
jgi:hypothetical protein